MNKEDLRCFGLSILLHMVEVCSMVLFLLFSAYTHINTSKQIDQETV
jgi:hypothetical protein